MTELRIISRDELGCFAGQASMCWIPTPSTQVFDSENAVKQLDELWNSLPLLSDLRECLIELIGSPLYKAKAILESIQADMKG